MSKIIHFKNKPSIISCGNCVGKLESDGPLKEYFDLTDPDSKFGMETWEKAESEMVRRAYEVALNKAKLRSEDISLVFGGDLSNQCTATALGMKSSGVAYAGLYGACSTFALGLGLSAMSVEGVSAERAAALASSHYSSAERQYRYPLEYGCQRTPTAQNTVTAAGCAVLSKQIKNEPIVSDFLPGIIYDAGITDVNNMGAAMAPAAADTVTRYFNEANCSPSDFDCILTGDLGIEGHSIFLELCRTKGLELSGVSNDCGKMIYDTERQTVNSGGSGCGCSAAVFTGPIYTKLKNKELRDVLLIGTGALLSPTTVLQNETIPGIAHLVRIRSEI